MNEPRTPADESSAPRDVSRWRLAHIELDETTLELRVRGELAAVERKPLELLMWLLRRPGEVVTKEELFDALWAGRVVTESVLTKCVAKLRSALGDDGQAILKTVHGFGYRLVAPVQRLQFTTGASTRAATSLQPGDAPPQRPHWRLLRRFEGSRGEVWLAEHRKLGELRVFKFAPDGAGLAQLKREVTVYRLLRETLGPRDDLVSVLDWNFDEAPYFVELAHCSQGNLADWLQAQGGAAEVPLATRVELIAQAADALAAAHSAGVLHKDIKPSNVLVELDAAGQPRVCLGDFGSGRVLDAERLRALEITRMGFTQTMLADASTSGTWAYLAPEVVGGQPPTVRADIFALGVLLYQVLVGDLRRPLAPGWERDIDDELLRTDVAACCDRDATHRLGDAGELARRLRALPARHAQEGARQQANAEAQAARTTLERVRARRPWLLGLAGVAGVALLAISVQYQQVRSARDQALQHATVAATVNDFLVRDLIAAANPDVAGVPDATVRSVLAQAGASLATRFAQQPDAAAALRNALGYSWAGIGDYDAAARLFEASARSSASEELRARAWLGLAQASNVSTRSAEAGAALDAARGLLASLQPAQPRLVLLHDVEAAALLMLNGDVEAGVRGLATLRPAVESTWGAGSPEAIRLLTTLAQAHVEAGRLDEGLALFREALAQTEAVAGPGHAGSLVQRFGIGQTLFIAGRREEAEVAYREAYALAQGSLGPDHLTTVRLGHGMANALPPAARAVEGRALLERLLATARQRFGADHEETQVLLNDLARNVGDAGERERERQMYAELLQLQRGTLEPGHYFMLVTMKNLARSHSYSGQHATALKWAAEAHDGARQSLGTAHYLTCVIGLQRAKALLDLARREEARQIAAPCAQQLSAQLGADHPHSKDAASLLARL